MGDINAMFVKPEDVEEVIVVSKTIRRREDAIEKYTLMQLLP